MQNESLARTLRRTPDGWNISVRVSPGAKKSELIEITEDGILRVRVSAPPVDGKANDAVIALLASLFECRRRDVTLIAGEKSRVKRFLLPPDVFSEGQV